jgi:hypothetical protein
MDATSAIRIILISIVAGFIGILLIDLKITSVERDEARIHVNALTQQINNQNVAIQKLNNDEMNHKKQIDLTLKEALKDRKIYDNKSDKILMSDVQSDCIKAIQWGADQAVIIYANF